MADDPGFVRVTNKILVTKLHLVTYQSAFAEQCLGRQGMMKLTFREYHSSESGNLKKGFRKFMKKMK